MKKVIENLELLKKLAPYLEYMETENVINVYLQDDGTERNSGIVYNRETLADIYKDAKYYKNYKTLTLEEAIELLPEQVYGECLSVIRYNFNEWEISYDNVDIKGKNLFQAIEKMLEYLIDNDLLGNK